ncbi:MAG: hypothetical protein AMXMBFR56_69680 [Polyangiaceae bacterium]
MLLVEAVLRSPILGAACRLTGRERTGLEARLRGMIPGGVHHGARLRLGRGVEFIAPEKIRLGEDVSLFGHTILNAFGPSGEIIIGDSTHIDHFAVLYGQGGLSIGKKCAIASRVTIYSQTNQYRDSPETPIVDQSVQYAPVYIGDDVWIGAGAVLLPGAHVGDHCVVAAGAIVRGGAVPPWSIVAGVPAKVIGDRRRAS